MMMSRAEIKLRAWQSVKYNYWPTIGAYLLFTLITYGLACIPFANIFVGLIIQAGFVGYFLNRFRKQETSVGLFFRPFNRYTRVLGGMLWKALWVILWTLLFIIPGIVKSYSYFCTEYILADSPCV